MHLQFPIILYKEKTNTTFTGCVRGFSGVTSYGTSDQLTFSQSDINPHAKSKILHVFITFNTVDEKGVSLATCRHDLMLQSSVRFFFVFRPCLFFLKKNKLRITLYY